MELRKIKVAMLAPRLYGSQVGGVGMHINKLTHYLQRRDDIELHWITFSNENKQFKRDNLNIHVIRKIIKHPGPLLLLQIPSLRHKIIEINPDIVHAQSTSAYYSTAVALVRKEYPSLLTVHGLTSKEIKFIRGFDFVYHRLISLPNEKYVLSKIPNIITVSPHVKEWVSNRTSSNIYVIPNGVAFDEIQSILIKTKDQLKHPAILFAGGLSKVKGIDTLLNAVPIIIKKIPDLHIYIAGSGPDESKLKKLVKGLNIEKSVNFLGFISGSDKYSWYKSVDVCVFPSLYETFGIVCLEAMACGKPVVASNVGGIPFVVEDGKTGLLFECGNVEDLAEKVIILLREKEMREKMGEAGRKRAKEFTWDKIADKTVKLYKAIISE